MTIKLYGKGHLQVVFLDSNIYMQESIEVIRNRLASSKKAAVK